MKVLRGKIASVLLLWMLLFGSACMTSPDTHGESIPSVEAETSAQPTPLVIYAESSELLPEEYISISPIENFLTDDRNNISGTTIRNITGYTNLPDGTKLKFFVYNTDINRLAGDMHGIIPVRGMENSSRSPFSHLLDMDGQPPGHYRITIESGFTKSVADFSIVSQEPWIWIHAGPVQNISIGKPVTVTGTTNLPPGSSITINPWAELHSCPPDIPRAGGARALCNFNCDYSPGPGTGTVIQGMNGTNIWTYTTGTETWCNDIEYGISATAGNWTNVTRAHVTFHTV